LTTGRDGYRAGVSNRDVVHASPIVAAVSGSRRRRTPKVERRPSETWFERAACIGQRGAFFPERGESPAAALELCASCPVRPECLAFAIRNHERFGIWGGLTESERRRAGQLRVAATG
jgi:WhiB family redox-sensing transcriptional regulator